MLCFDFCSAYWGHVQCLFQSLNIAPSIRGSYFNNVQTLKAVILARESSCEDMIM